MNIPIYPLKQVCLYFNHCFSARLLWLKELTRRRRYIYIGQSMIADVVADGQFIPTLSRLPASRRPATGCTSSLSVRSTVSFTHQLTHSPVCSPVRAPGRNAPLIRFLISAVYVLFACLYRVLSHLSFFLHFFFTYFLPYLSFPLRIENSPSAFPGRML